MTLRICYSGMIHLLEIGLDLSLDDVYLIEGNMCLRELSLSYLSVHYPFHKRRYAFRTVILQTS